jgi:3-deoxy-D-manno-octulosonate 8-phosphate phosphatase (KDO 8-P phosphatase)
LTGAGPVGNLFIFIIEEKMAKKKLTKKEILKRASKIKLMLTDVDGVLTDTGVFYSVEGEQMKRFSIRDGMGIERLRDIAGVATGIITRENTQIVGSRARRLKIEELHMGVWDKTVTLNEIITRRNISLSEVAYIGDDTNDVDIMKMAGLSACPSDATKFAKEAADLIVESKGGYGAVRDLCELIIDAKTAQPLNKKNGKK